MYLSHLEIVGFKSFAHKTLFKFTDGLTTVVGPNGCGKTNVVDAIRWALGEQKSSILRSEVMDNVIFNGTNTRKPLGMAEVSLTLQNTKKILPTEYTEVTVTRRLFRNGDSQYLLNNTQCRLKDIVELFMDTGMGPDSYSVIELKMVEDILNGKAEERRHLIEEAAGVTKYKSRRREAGRKLIDVQNDLLRAKDLVQEVQKQVNSLSRQASKTRRYNNLLEEMHSIELVILKCDYDKIKNDIDEINSIHENLTQDKKVQETDLAEREIELGKLKKSHLLAEENHSNALEKENEINIKIEKKNTDIALTHEKIESLKNTCTRILRDIDESGATIESIIENIESSGNVLTELKAQKESSGNNLNQEKSVRDEISKMFQSARNSHNLILDDIKDLQNSIESINSTFEKNSSRLIAIRNNIQDNQTDIDNVKTEISDNIESTNICKKLSVDLEMIVQEASLTLKKAQEKYDALQEEIEKIKTKINDEKNALSHKQASFDFLSSLIDSDETTKYLVKSDKWLAGVEKVLFAEAIAIDDKYSIAIDAALGEAVRFFVVDRAEDAMNAVSLLKENNKGKATFICRELIPSIPKPSENPSGKGIIGWVSEIVRTDDTLRNALRAILGKCLLVEDLETARNCINKSMAESAVTLQGETVHKSGVIRGGSVPKTEVLTLGKREKIENLKKEIQQINKNIESLQKKFESLQTEFKTIDLNSLNAELRNAENEKSNNEQMIAQLNLKHEMFENNLSLHEKNSERFKLEIAEIEKENENDKIKLVEFEKNLNLKNAENNDISNKVQELETELEEKNEVVRNEEMNFVRLEETIKNTILDIEKLNAQKIQLENKITSNKEEIAQSESKIIQLESSIEQHVSELEKLKTEFEIAQNETENFQNQMASLLEQIEQYTQDFNNFRKTFDKTIETLHQNELTISEYRSMLSSIKNRTTENHNKDIEELEIEIAEEFSIEESKSKVAVLKEKLTSLGEVNFMALQDFEEQSQRLDFLVKQIKDLEDAEKNLKDTISEINITAQQKFRDTFDLVHSHFKELFTTLFGPDGYAELKLGDGDPLEANVEIFAKPPGKKPHSIDMLSGGEKTLTAIALLFAIYLVKPSPFCILDEVDAPLDDSNIDKYINLIRRFSNNTQFLMVTHNKRTMETSDNLYGISMPEEGVSKVVSVKFNNEKIAS